MAGVAHALALGAHSVGKDLADVNPDDRALREGKECDVGDEQPHQHPLIRVRGEYPGHAGEAACRARRADQKQGFTAQPVDHRHTNNGEYKIREADGDGLLIARNLAEAGSGEDVIQVIEDGVDTGQLIERADGDGQKERIAVLPSKDRLVGRGVFLGQRGANVGQFALWIRLAHQLQYCQGLVVAVPGGGPARATRAARNAEEQC